MTPVLIFVCVVSLMLTVSFWRARLASKRRQHIRSATLPMGLYDKLRERHPQLALKDCSLVAQGLRQFFMSYSRSGHQYVSMPSQVVDDLWHEFILHTRAYDAFCQQAFGRFFHHTPAAALGGNGNTQMNAGLRRCWWYACREDNINPAKPTRLPLIFALDTKLNIVNGFRYAPDCSGLKVGAAAAGGAIIYCGGDFSSSSVDGSTDGFGDGSSSDGSSGDGGGCGGGGGD